MDRRRLLAGFLGLSAPSFVVTETRLSGRRVRSLIRTTRTEAAVAPRWPRSCKVVPSLLMPMGRSSRSSMSKRCSGMELPCYIEALQSATVASVTRGTRRVRNRRIGTRAAEPRDRSRGRSAFWGGANQDRNCVNLESCPNTMITRVKASRGASNIYVLKSEGTRMSFLELRDARGPMPRGQSDAVQSVAPNSILEDFSAENGPTSWTEDNVSVFQSDRCVVRAWACLLQQQPDW